jgi:hypothetical protein
MVISAALLLAAAPLPATLPPGVTLIGSVRAEIIRAERVAAEPGPNGAQRSLAPERDGFIVEFN